MSIGGDPVQVLPRWPYLRYHGCNFPVIPRKTQVSQLAGWSSDSYHLSATSTPFPEVPKVKLIMHLFASTRSFRIKLPKLLNYFLVEIGLSDVISLFKTWLSYRPERWLRGSRCLPHMPGDQGSIPGTHRKVEGENKLHRVALWSPHSNHHTHAPAHIVHIQTLYRVCVCI